MNTIEITGTIIGALATLLVAYKTVVEKLIESYLQKKKEEKSQEVKGKIHQSNSNTLTESLDVYKLVRFLSKEYDCNRVMILGLHNGGQILTKYNEKKISMFYEDTSGRTVKEIDLLWQGRVVDYEMLRFVSHLDEDEVIHYTDIEGQSEDSVGIRKLLNAKQGSEVFVVKLGWFGQDKLMFLLMQRDLQNTKPALQPYQKDVIVYKAGEIKEMLKSTTLKK